MHDSHAVTSLALSFDATLLVAGSSNGSVAVWDIACRQLLKAFTQHSGVCYGE